MVGGVSLMLVFNFKSCLRIISYSCGCHKNRNQRNANSYFTETMSTPPPMNPEYQEDQVPNSSTPKTADPTNRQFAGAAIAGGIAGAVIAGPVIGILAAGGLALATTAPGKGGQAARTSGDAMAKAGDKAKSLGEKHHIKDKAKAGAQKGVGKMKELDEKHHIKDKAKASASKGGQKMKDIDEQHDLSGKAKKGMSKGYNKAKEVDKKQDLSGKAAKGMMKGATWVSKKATQPTKTTTAT
jgi:hypothetical protein